MFTLAPKLSNALSIIVSPIVQEISGHPGSFNFKGIGCDKNSEMFDARKILLGTCVTLLLVHSSFNFFA